ncbi:MAG: hypothetical protein H0V09_01400 [Gemmatimonadetes bacterium]|nr:hypothetical protein [Gemmatimonadota bacterium]
MAVFDAWPWGAAALLGVYHGVNPAMGWLFAVALGMQEGSRAAVLRALPPIAAGHLISVACFLVILGTASRFIERDVLRIAAAGALTAFGAFRLALPRAHPRWVGMRVSGRDLALWSFLVSGSHGAGLMLAPLMLGPSPAGASHGTGAHDALDAGALFATVGTRLDGATLGDATLRGAGLLGIHTIGMLAVTAVLALLVFEKLGLAFLRTAWVNLDAVWAVSLIAAGLLTFASA